MTEAISVAGRLLAALALVALNGFFVASEFAFVRVRSTAVDQLVADGKAGAQTLRDALDKLDDYLAATQLGITIASLALGWLGEPAIAALIEPVLSSFVSEQAVHLIAVVVGFSVITFLHVVYGELAAKTLSIAAPARMALLVAPPMKLFYTLFKPALIVLNGTANRTTSLFGIPPASETEATLSEEELRRALANAQEGGQVDADEAAMIERVFELDDRTARDIMVPRPNVQTIAADMPLSELRSHVAQQGHTRYPVVDAESGERPVGFIDVKSVLQATEDVDRTADTNTEPITAGDLADDTPAVPESRSADALLEELRDEQRQMAIVIDEWGTVEGIATIEDIVEVVVGDIRDEFDDATDERSITPDGESGGYIADGAVAIAEVNERLDTELNSGAYSTLAGFVLDRLGRQPEANDQVTDNGHQFTVTAVNENRIDRIRITAADETTSPQD